MLTVIMDLLYFYTICDSCTNMKRLWYMTFWKSFLVLNLYMSTMHIHLETLQFSMSCFFSLVCPSPSFFDYIQQYLGFSAPRAYSWWVWGTIWKLRIKPILVVSKTSNLPAIFSLKPQKLPSIDSNGIFAFSNLTH